MTPVFVVDACRTPIGKVKGVLAGVRPDHLAADAIRALVGRNPGLDVAAIDDVTGAPRTRPARTTGTWPGWPCCWPGCRWRSRAPR